LKKAIAQGDSLAVKTVESVQNQLARSSPDSFFLLTLAFNFPRELAKSCGRHLLFIWDEFQCIEGLNNYPGVGDVLRLFRAAMQRQGDVSYLLAGSATSIMNRITEDHNRPLFV
jgi:hypothetical protein